MRQVDQSLDARAETLFRRFPCRRPTIGRQKKRFAILIAALILTVVAPASAAAYWDYQNWLDPGFSYGEGQGQVGTWWIRLSRSNCRAKMEVHARYGTWAGVEFPGGCAQGDYSRDYFTGPPDFPAFDASHGKNTYCCESSFANIRIDSSV
jgi:hypothetical protein